MYKLYEFAMPLTAKAKNLLLITQNDRYLSQDLTSILHNTPLHVSCGREGGWGLPRLPASESASLVSPGHSHTANTRH